MGRGESLVAENSYRPSHSASGLGTTARSRGKGTGGESGGGGRSYTKIVSYTVVCNASKPIIRRRRVPAAQQKWEATPNGYHDATQEQRSRRGHQQQKQQQECQQRINIGSFDQEKETRVYGSHIKRRQEWTGIKRCDAEHSGQTRPTQTPSSSDQTHNVCAQKPDNYSDVHETEGLSERDREEDREESVSSDEKSWSDKSDNDWSPDGEEWPETQSGPEAVRGSKPSLSQQQDFRDRRCCCACGHSLGCAPSPPRARSVQLGHHSQRSRESGPPRANQPVRSSTQHTQHQKDRWPDSHFQQAKGLTTSGHCRQALNQQPPNHHQTQVYRWQRQGPGWSQFRRPSDSEYDDSECSEAAGRDLTGEDPLAANLLELSRKSEDARVTKRPRSVRKQLEGLEHLPDRVLMYNKRDPVSILMEYGQTREVKVSFTEVARSGPHHASRFHTAAVVDGETYPSSTGTSKKTAKKAASIVALRAMYDKGMAHLGQANVTVNQELKELKENGLATHEHLSHSGKVMYASRRLLELAEETQFINYSKDKVLAAVVLERRGRYNVAGLGTGNRVIQYQHLATNGSRLIHSHAEVIARRAFIRYLLKELAAYRPSEKHHLFTRNKLTSMLKLHDEIKVHLYISRPPCGDAAAFPTITNFPNRMRAIRKQGQLRTIIDDGEGAIPTDFSLPANPNGKERLRVMTCSDKILRWNAVGVQGGLLSNFMDPIYLNSVVIGSHTGDQRGHVPRAISGRLKCGRLHEVLNKPYRIVSPEISYPILPDNYAINKSKQYCITWTEGDPDAEVIDAVTGAVAMEPTDESPSSRISKRALLAQFRKACLNLGAGQLATLTYAQSKQAAKAFQRTKASVYDHLLTCGFGQWISIQALYGTDNFSQDEPETEKE